MADAEVAPAPIPPDPQPRHPSPLDEHDAPAQITVTVPVEQQQQQQQRDPPGDQDTAADPLPTTEQPDARQAHDSSAPREAPSLLAPDDAQSGGGPYSTRSRNRGNAPRPNYSDDIEMDFERPLSRREAGASARSSSLETASKADGEPSRPPQTIKLHTRAQPAEDYRSFNAAARSDENSSSPMPGDGRSDGRKRKLNRTSASKAGANSEDYGPGNARDAIPGTSQFFAAPNGSADAPLPKKRRTGDDVGTSGNASRNSSMSHTSPAGPSDSCFVSFENSNATLRNGKLEADDGTTYAKDDTVYLICEPPGDPYYICRIMEFRHKISDDKQSPVVSMLINWFYRPKDIGKFSSDPRQLFASMQSDECPLSSLRGKCHIKHRTELSNVEDFRRQRDTFHFNQLYDRYSHRPYEMIPCSAVINIPPDVKKALDDRWRFIVVEQQAVKELTSPPKNCKLCHKYCAPNDSVDCGVCRDTFHLGCVDPPLPKRPSRGFAWSCGPCSRDRERKLQQRHMAVPNHTSRDSQDEATEQEEQDASAEPGIITVPNAASRSLGDAPDALPEQADVAKANMWPWRYLGVHCRVEDVLQNDDRAIYPRATSRTGNKHQAEIDEWPGRPIDYVKLTDIGKRAKGSTTKKDPKVSRETMAAIQHAKAERAKRPIWVKDEPRGYVARGEDFDEGDERCTAVPLFVKPVEVAPARSGFVAANARGPPDDKMIDQYIKEAKELANGWGLVTISKKGDPQISSNYLDHALKVLSKNRFNFAASLDALRSKHDPSTLKNPDFSKEEVQKFENGVAKYGSDLRSVRKYYVRGRSYGEIVRFYYTWKFSQRGAEIWGTHSGRKGVKRRAESSWIDIADEEDDSAFDNDKATAKKRRFTCKFCSTRHSRQWRRAPGVAPGATVLADPRGGKDKSNQLIVALCQRCAHPWRRYALVWEDPDEIAKSILSSGGRQWKRKNDEELLRELVLANEATRVPSSSVSAQAAAQIGIEVTMAAEPKKKVRASGEKEQTPTLSSSEQTKKKAAAAAAANAPRVPTPPPEPVPPKWRQLPCAVCRYEESTVGDTLVTCKECKLTVHFHCYGVSGTSNPAKWVCDTCLNDKQTQHSLRYECALCPVRDRTIEMLEMPKESKQKKKSDRDKEKERLEKKMYDDMLDEYQKSQKKKGRPIYPREALKLTASNNWMHVTCAMWTPEIKFSEAKAMKVAEGMGVVASNPARMDALCKICRIPEGSCVACAHCHQQFHVACAHEAGYHMGFDITPVKGSRKDPNQIVSIGPESGVMTAAIWCRDHAVKTIIHDMAERVKMDETDVTTLQLFTQTYKQADLALTGTARKATLVGAAARTLAQAGPSSQNRRASVLVNGTATKGAAADDNYHDVTLNGNTDDSLEDRRCRTCGIDFALKWHRIAPEDAHMTNGATEHEPSAYQCHKCFTRAERGLSPVSPKKEPEPDVLLQPYAPPPDLFRAPRVTPLAEKPRGVDSFDELLRGVTISLTNPKFGGLHVFRGHELSIDQSPDGEAVFNYIRYWAVQSCGFDQAHDVIINEDGAWVTWPKSMVQALMRMAVNGIREAHWRIMTADEVPCKLLDGNDVEPRRRGVPAFPNVPPLPNGPPVPNAPPIPNGLPPPMPGHFTGPPPGYVAPGYPMTMAAPGHPPARTGYPPHPVHGSQHALPTAHVDAPPTLAGQIPFGRSTLPRLPSASYQHNALLPGQPPNFPPPDVLAQRPPQYFHRHNNSGGGSASTPPRDTLTGGGASSSPSLRNLMH